MAQKFLYIVDHYIPFPSSEYGGIWNVIAEHDDECFDLISAEDADDFYDEQKANAITIKGIIQSYNQAIKNKPGNFLLKGENIPLAYLYSISIDLTKYIGKEVSITVSPRSNNNFAFPAYFVNSVE